jgi:hypothetical protein
MQLRNDSTDNMYSESLTLLFLTLCIYKYYELHSKWKLRYIMVELSRSLKFRLGDGYFTKTTTLFISYLSLFFEETTTISLL